MSTILPHPAGFGLLIEGFDPRRADAKDAELLRGLIHEHKLVVIQAAKLSRPDYLAFARTLGRPQIYFQPNYHHPEHPEIFVSSNVPEKGKKVGVAGTGRFWHSDYQFFDEPLSLTTVAPQHFTCARATQYIDLEWVAENLPAPLRQAIAGRFGIQDATWYFKVRPSDTDRPLLDLVTEFRRECPGAIHPLIIRHPIHGREALYASHGFTTGIVGMGPREGAQLLEEIFGWIDAHARVYEIPWTEGAIFCWDNRTVIHRASETPAGSETVSYRIGVYDDLPFYRDPGPRPPFAFAAASGNPRSIQR